MESPDRWLTNIHRVDNVLLVQWSVYSATNDTELGPTSDRAGLIPRLENAQYELWSRGQLALYDRELRVLWHFLLAHQGREHDDLSQLAYDNASTITSKYKLTRVSTGPLSASSLPGPSAQESPFPATTAHAFQPDQNKRFPFSKSISPSLVNTKNSANPAEVQVLPIDSGVTPPDTILRDRLQQSATRLIIYGLISTGNWLPLERDKVLSRTFSQTEYRNAAGDNPIARLRHSLVPAVVTMRTLWLPNGSLIIASCETSHSLIKAVSQNQRTFSPLIALKEVVLIPFGVDAVAISRSRFLPAGVTDSSTAQTKMLVAWRSQVEHWLCVLGIPMSRDDGWIIVETGGRNGAPLRIPWPEEFCFPKLTGTVTSKRNAPYAGDLLQMVEEWQLGFIQNREPFRLPDLSSHEWAQRTSLQLRTMDDNLFGVLQQQDHTRENIGAAGIYPTPPDGARGLGAHSGEAQSALPWTLPATVGFDRSEREGDFEPGLSTHATAPEPPFERFEDDELFHHANASMYADNGITEDDFSFFDEPDTGTKNSPENNLSPEVARLGSSLRFSSSPQDQCTSDVKVLAEEKNNGVSQEITATEAYKQPEFNKSEINVPDLPVEPLNFTPEPVMKDSDSLQPSLDDKYGEQGKYFHPNEIISPSTALPSSILRTPFRIPTIQPSAHSESSSESDPMELESEDAAFAPLAAPLSSVSRSSRAYRFEFLDNPNQHLRRNMTTSTEAFERLMMPPKNGSDTSLSTEQWRTTHQEVVLNRTLAKFSGKFEVFTRIVQLVADQSVFLYIPRVQEHGANDGFNMVGGSRNDELGEVLSAILPRCVQCDIQSCYSIYQSEPSIPENAGNLGMSNSQNKQSSAQVSSVGHENAVISLNAPKFRARRGGRIVDISLHAFQFWQELGLSPYEGPKDLTSFCLFPEHTSLERRVISFLNSMRDAYASLRLGVHSVGSSQRKELQSGLLELPSMQDRSSAKLLETACEKFGRSLQALASHENPVVIYIINPSADPTSVQELCALFAKIFDCYVAGIRGIPIPSDLVLKIIPITFLTSMENAVFLPAYCITELSIEIYDRCPLKTSAMSPYATHSLVQLSPELPASIAFKLTASSTPSLLENECLSNLAYCWDKGSSWLNAVWIDRLGCHTWSGSFYIDQNGDIQQGFRLIAKEIVEVVIEGMEQAHGRPSLLLAKDSDMADMELEAWTSVIREKEVNFFAVILLDTNPTLQLRVTPHPTNNPEAGATPASVPATPDIASPDLHGPKGFEDIDLNTRLISKANEGWALPLNHSLHCADGRLELRATLAGGYVIQRHEVAFEVKMVHAEGMKPDSLQLLKTQYDLACLAKLRGSTRLLPWPVLAARKAHDGLLRSR